MGNFYLASIEDQTERLRCLAIEALKRWGVRGPEPKLLKYRENAVYRVDLPDGRAAALRLHRHGYHSDAELASELSWMAALGVAGIAVPKVVPALDGSTFIMAAVPEIPEPRQVDMLEWLDGEAFGSLETGLNKNIQDVGTAFRWVGELVARMHNQAQNWSLPNGFTRHAWDIDGLVGENPFWGRFWDLRSLTPAQRTLLLRAGAISRLDLAAYGQTPDNYGLIHADLLTDNMILGNGHVKALDFDDSGFGWHLFDIATILLMLREEDSYEQILHGVVQGYRTARALPDEQLAHLPLFLLVRSFTYLGWIHTRSETPAAAELAPVFTDLACNLAEEYLSKC
jgi:Ser/Thr protein kinase RdoA (MazF antagonist)